MRATHRVEVTLEVAADDDEDVRDIAQGLLADYITSISVTLIEDIDDAVSALPVKPMTRMEHEVSKILRTHTLTG